MLKKSLVVAFGIAVIVIGLWFALPMFNDRQADGTLTLSGLDAPVRVVRDSRGTPYIYAESIADVLRAQGFVTGQDRLFQVEAARRAATGQLSEVFGPGPDNVILNLDREARVIGFRRLGQRQAKLLTPQVTQRIEDYLTGLNAYIRERRDTHPLEFRLAGFEPQVWTREDLLAVVFYLGWQSAANFDAELIAHDVIQRIGAEAFSEIAPLTVNPDDPISRNLAASSHIAVDRWIGEVTPVASWTKGGVRQLGIGGSNNWAIGGTKAGQQAAIVTNDPHLDSRNLPGPWHPVGLITPEMRVVGVSAGLLGVTIGRNEHIAFGVTNAYSDAIDLYVETVDPSDPDKYLEGDRSIAFETLDEPIRVKDDSAEGGYRTDTIRVRLTRRGPVISDDSVQGDTVLSMRWASAEYMGSEIGVDQLMEAANVDEALEAIEQTRIVSLNFVVGDIDGNIARRASGAAPIRTRGDGMSPLAIVNTVDNWAGRIPPDQMPGEVNPSRGWTGSANHMTADANFPYTYTTFASPNYRYRRIQELMAGDTISTEQAWLGQYDTLNIFARDVAPILAAALSSAQSETLREAGSILAAWDYHDTIDEIAPTLFQETIRQLARLTFEDELGVDGAAVYLANWYVWQQRFDRMLQDGESHWFDDQRTANTESLADLIRIAGTAALERLEKAYGQDRASWQWGRVHQLHFSGPLRRQGWVGRLTGNRSIPMPGSGETLLRALYPFDQPYDLKWFASLRMTADLNDPDKVYAVLPGGAVGRTGHANLSDQLSQWEKQDSDNYWWFSDQAIEANAANTLTLLPETGQK
ncbi:MAG: penicillin acylase family protein [Pseudomonadota bacterium]